MAWTTPGTATAGDVLTASFWNTQVRDNLNDHESRLGANSAKSLVTPTSVSGTGVSSSGGKISLSAATTAQINGVFSSTYEVYEIVFSLQGSANNQYSYMRLTASGVASSAGYLGGYRSFDYAVASTAFAAGDGNITDKIAFGNPPNASSSEMISRMTISNPFASKYSYWTGSSTGVATTVLNGSWIYGGSHLVTTSYDGIYLFSSVGTMTGTVRIIGYRNS